MAGELAILERIQRKVLWLATWMVHTANARPNTDGTKVGGHQASSASVVSLLTALYFKALRPGDVVATKAHAAPAFYAIQFLRGRLDGARLATLRDRKSTRLNSSHSQISYAVFCLIKTGPVEFLLQPFEGAVVLHAVVHAIYDSDTARAHDAEYYSLPDRFPSLSLRHDADTASPVP